MLDCMRRMARTGGRALLVACGLATLPFGRAHAQRGRRNTYSTEPNYWVGLSLGYQNGMTVFDGATGNTWQFGYTSQLRATLEKTLEPGVSLGVSAGFSTAPLTYENFSAIGVCEEGCNAQADITQYMVFLHGSTARTGFHGVYELEAGETEFSNFREKGTNLRLAPTDAAYDFSFGIGGGVEYTLSTTASVYVTPIYDFVLHPQGNNPSASAPRLFTLRAGTRIGF